MFNKRVRIFILLLFSIFIFSATSSVFAGGNGDGTGGGGGASVPLEVTSIDVREDEVAITFSKNVTNASVKENNLNSFELYDNNGKSVSFVVSIPDDNLEPEKRQTITLVLTSPLNSGEEYNLVVKSGLGAKSGQIIEEDRLFILKVGEDPISSNEDSNEVIITKEEATSSNSNSIFTSPLFYVVVLIIVGVVILVYVIKRKSK